MRVIEANDRGISCQTVQVPSKAEYVIKCITLAVCAILSLATLAFGLVGIMTGAFNCALLVLGLALLALTVVVASQVLLDCRKSAPSDKAVPSSDRDAFFKRLNSAGYPSKPFSGSYHHADIKGDNTDVALLGANEDLNLRSYLVDGDVVPLWVSSRFQAAYIRHASCKPTAILPRKLCKYSRAEDRHVYVNGYSPEELTRRMYYCEAGNPNRWSTLDGFCQHPSASVCYVNEVAGHRSVCLEEALEEGKLCPTQSKPRCADQVAILRECDERGRPCKERISKASCEHKDYVVIDMEGCC